MKYLHPIKKQFVSKEEYFKFILSKEYPSKPFNKKSKQLTK